VRNSHTDMFAENEIDEIELTELNSRNSCSYYELRIEDTSIKQ
jgi:hypothetical protein